MLEKPEVLPAALDGVVNRTKLAAVRIGEACSPLEINDEFERLGNRIEVTGDDLPWRCQSECLSKKMFNSHGREHRDYSRDFSSRKAAHVIALAPESCPQEPAAPTSFQGAHSRGGTLWTTFLQGLSGFDLPS